MNIRSLFRASLIGLSFGLLLTACEEEIPWGYIEVRSPSSGTYEIYRIDSEHPLQFTSEHIGLFNEKVAVSPGSYLILADCSSETVIVHPNAGLKLVAHQLNFIPPSPIEESDKFSIQCDRFDKMCLR